MLSILACLVVKHPCGGLLRHDAVQCLCFDAHVGVVGTTWKLDLLPELLVFRIVLSLMSLARMCSELQSALLSGNGPQHFQLLLLRVLFEIVLSDLCRLSHSGVRFVDALCHGLCSCDS